MSPEVAKYLAQGGKITVVPRSKRTLNTTQMSLLCRGESTAFRNYTKEREERLADAAARRDQRGKPRG